MLAIVHSSGLKTLKPSKAEDLSNQCGQVLQNRNYPAHRFYYFTLDFSDKVLQKQVLKCNFHIEYMPLFSTCFYRYESSRLNELSDPSIDSFREKVLPVVVDEFVSLFVKSVEKNSTDEIVGHFIENYSIDNLEGFSHLEFSIKQSEEDSELPIGQEKINRPSFENLLEDFRIWKKNDATGESNCPDMVYLKELMAKFNSESTPEDDLNSFLGDLGSVLAKKVYHPEKANFFIIPIMNVQDALMLIAGGKEMGHYWSANTRTRRGDIVLFYFGKKADGDFLKKAEPANWKIFFDNIHGSVFGTARILTDIFDDKKRGYGGKWVFFGDTFIYDVPINIFELRDDFGSEVAGEITKAGFFKPKFLPEGSPFLTSFRNADAGRSPHFKISKPDVPDFPEPDASDDDWARAFKDLSKNRFLSEQAVQAYFIIPLLRKASPENCNIDLNFSNKENNDSSLYLPVIPRMQIALNDNNVKLNPTEEKALVESKFKTIILIDQNDAYKVSWHGRQKRSELLFRRDKMNGDCIRRFRTWLEDYFFGCDSDTVKVGEKEC